MSVTERAPAPEQRRQRAADVEPTQPGLIQPTYVHAPRFAPGSAESVAYLREHGYVVKIGRAHV